MLTAHTIKVIQSLDKKKYRQKYGLFLVEGDKVISELADSNFEIQELFSVTPETLSKHFHATQIDERQLRKISHLQNPKNSVALCKIPEQEPLPNIDRQIVLDGIQDPGNLGTIIRLADWFGLEQLVCSEDTADLYNPKTIQASMGSFTRVNCFYTDLAEYLDSSEAGNIGTDMDGTSVFDFSFPKKFNLILGNEGNGIREEIGEKLHHMVSIPRFGKNKNTESLNVAMAAGIILGQIFSKN